MKYIAFFILFIILALIIYIYKKRKTYTRERYAFVATLSMMSFASIIFIHIFTDNSLIKIAIELLNQFAGTKINTPETSWSDKAWSFFIFVFLGIFILQIYKNWTGKISQIESDYGMQSLLQNSLRGIPWRKIIEAENTQNNKKNNEEPYFDISLDWHTDVAEILKMKSNQYYIDIDKDWYSEEELFISKFSQQHIAIYCTLTEPSELTIKEKITFIKKHTNNKLDTFIIAIKNVKKETQIKEIKNVKIQYRYKNELLNSLINFNEYFDYIRKEFEDKEISYGDNITIKDIYTENKGEIYSNSESIKEIASIESYLLEWTKQKSNKHISLLGEYGQGKSVLSLKLAYEMIINKNDRIPIIIELRGKSPKNDQIENIIASWASKFHIDPLAIMRLLIEGKLLIILEGFDEMDMIGDSNRRLEHFNRLWEFARYEKNKVLITGRPNLFLDNNEMQEYLKSYTNNSNLFYSETIHIKPFNLTQIEYALKNMPLKIKNEIISFLKINSNKSFQDLISRPSTLYQTSIIWNSLNKDKINSTSIIAEFIDHAYKRQEEKLRSIGRTGVETLLTTNERKYFIIGIAIGMVQSNGYTNQINSEDLEKLIQKLYSSIPEKISTDHSSNKSLKLRMQDNKQALDSVYNDIRTSTILVRDLTTNNSFKFAHKSFLEYLCAKYFVEFRLKDNNSKDFESNYKLYIEGIEIAYNNILGGSKFSDETVEFIVDMIKLDDNDIECDKILKFISPKTFLIQKLFFNLKYFIALILLITLLIIMYDTPQQNKFMNNLNYLNYLAPLLVSILILSSLKIATYHHVKNYLEIFNQTCKLLSNKFNTSIFKINIIKFHHIMKEKDYKKLNIFDQLIISYVRMLKIIY